MFPKPTHPRNILFRSEGLHSFQGACSVERWPHETERAFVQQVLSEQRRWASSMLVLGAPTGTTFSWEGPQPSEQGDKETHRHHQMLITATQKVRGPCGVRLQRRPSQGGDGISHEQQTAAGESWGESLCHLYIWVGCLCTILCMRLSHYVLTLDLSTQLNVKGYVSSR